MTAKQMIDQKHISNRATPQPTVSGLTFLSAKIAMLLSLSNALAQVDSHSNNQLEGNKPAVSQSTITAHSQKESNPKPATYKSKLNRYEYSFPSMGTIVRIVVYSDRLETIESDLFAVESEANRLIQVFSSYDPESEISRLNKISDRETWLNLSPELSSLLLVADQIHAETDGGFDASLGILTRYWKAVRQKRLTYNRTDVTKLRKFCGWDQIELDAETQKIRFHPIVGDKSIRGTDVLLRQLHLPDAVQIDLGGIAKGAIIDAMFNELTERKLRICLVDAGGDIRVGQPPPGRQGWRVAIGKLAENQDIAKNSDLGTDAKPNSAPNLSEQMILTLNNQAIATSGDLHQYVVLDGIRYSHILDPKTGLGVLGRRSISVVAENGTFADAYATALSTTSPEKAIEFVEKTEKVDCIWSTIHEGPNNQNLYRKKSSMIEFEKVSE